jgi:hypothetical protein
MSQKFFKAVSVWLIMLIAAILNGLIREQLITPVVGEFAGRVISSLILSAFIFGITIIFIPWFRISRVSELWSLGAFWAALTITFEFIFGRIQGFSWHTLLAHYKLLEGRLWFIVPLTALISPRLSAVIRKNIAK